MSKRKKNDTITETPQPESDASDPLASADTSEASTVDPNATSENGEAPSSEAWSEPPPRDTMVAPAPDSIPRSAERGFENAETVNLSGDEFPMPGRDEFGDVTQTELAEVEQLDAMRDRIEEPTDEAAREAPRDTSAVAATHLKGLLEALVFASDHPIKANELAKSASAPAKEVKEALDALKSEYASRGVQLDEVAGGWIFRTNAAYAPFVRDLTKQKAVKLTRAQIETLAILAYRQPITRPEIDEIRGVDSGPVLKLLLDRDLIRILGKKDEPGRPLLYGTTTHFLEFFGLKSVKDLPTLREFTELNEDSRRVVERELGETLETVQDEHVREGVIDAASSIGSEAGESLGADQMPGEEDVEVLERLPSDTIPPDAPDSIKDTSEGEPTAEGEADAEEDEEDEYDDDLFDDDDDDDDDEDEDEDSEDEAEDAET